MTLITGKTKGLRLHCAAPETTGWQHSTCIPIMLTQISALRFQLPCSGGSQPWRRQQVRPEPARPYLGATLEW